MPSNTANAGAKPAALASAAASGRSAANASGAKQAALSSVVALRSGAAAQKSSSNAANAAAAKKNALSNVAASGRDAAARKPGAMSRWRHDFRAASRPLPASSLGPSGGPTCGQSEKNCRSTTESAISRKRLSVDQHLEPAIDHALAVERHVLHVHAGNALVLHHLGVDAVAIFA
jgi:hypothetical protein